MYVLMYGEVVVSVFMLGLCLISFLICVGGTGIYVCVRACIRVYVCVCRHVRERTHACMCVRRNVEASS